MADYSPDDLAEVFHALQAAGFDAILVGGQAVNLWASRFEEEHSDWQALRPFTSRDLDYLGGVAEARLAMRALHATGQLNSGDDPSPNAGVLRVQLADGRELIVDVLTGLYGVSTAELERTCVVFAGAGALSGLTLRVIHPLLLLEGKLAAWRGLPQADRQDAKHVEILLRVVCGWLREQLSDPRRVFRAAERLAACAWSPQGLHAYSHGLDLLQAFPIDDMRQAAGFEAFLGQRFPQIVERTADRRKRHMEALAAASGSGAA